MEGLMFFWIGWLYWISFTFFMNKQNPNRMKLGSGVLMMICLSGLHFKIGSFDLYVSGLFLMAVSYYLIGRERAGAMMYIFICSFIVTISYATFHLFEIFDPVWIIFKKDWMMAICLSILAVLLQKNLKGRLLISAAGTMQGELLYAYYLNQYDFPYPIGSYDFLDVYLLITLLLTCWSGLENSSAFFANHFNILGKTKQKSS